MDTLFLVPACFVDAVILLQATLQCLKKVEKVPTKVEALRQLTALASGSHVSPGDATWPLGSHFPAAKTPAETGTEQGLRLWSLSASRRLRLGVSA